VTWIASGPQGFAGDRACRSAHDHEWLDTDAFGTAIVGTALVLNVTGPHDQYVLALVPLLAVAVIGMIVGGFLPGRNAVSPQIAPAATEQ
jgi:hypothetical protein